MNDYQPYSLEAEQNVLGALLGEQSRFAHEIAELLDDDEFYLTSHRLIYRAMLTIDAEGRPIDPILVSDRLGSDLNTIGGLGYLAQLAHVTMTPKNLKHYVDVIKDKARERKVLEIANGMKNIIVDSDDTTDVKINNALALPVTFENSEYKEKTSVQFLKESIDNLEFRHYADGKITGLKTGFKDIDNRFQGLQSGQLMILAARPAMGKTTLALTMAVNSLFDGNQGTTLFFSLEMSGKELMDKIICSVGGIDYRLFKMGFPKNIPECEKEWPKVSNATAKLKQVNNLEIDDRSGITLQQIRAKAIRVKRRNGLKVIFIDYLTYIKTPGKDNRVLEVGALSRGLKALAKELECPIVCLAQLSRKVEERTDKTPGMADLRDSGEIEQDADIITMIYRDEVYNEDSKRKGYAEIITVKNRAGEIGSDFLKADLKHSRFCNLTEDDFIPKLEEKKRSL